MKMDRSKDTCIGVRKTYDAILGFLISIPGGTIVVAASPVVYLLSFLTYNASHPSYISILLTTSGFSIFSVLIVAWIVAGVSIIGNVATVILASVPALATGQTVTISNAGSAYNGNHEIIGTYPWTNGTATFNWWAVYPFVRNSFPNGYSMIQFNVTHADDPYHQIVPYGKCKVTDSTGVDYAQEAPIRLAALELAIDMWQAKQQSNAGGISPDFSPSPYRMGRSLLNRVNGLFADYLSPKGMVG